ncbi:MAG: hypothetical protein H5T59_05800, partial [Anaerolineae bacterium]|nr:hypothetical protein [Anaerolineae bacterium]
VGLVGLLVYHGCNGVRLILLGLGWGLDRQRELFWGLMALGAVAWAVAGWVLVTHLLG